MGRNRTAEMAGLGDMSPEQIKQMRATWARSDMNLEVTASFVDLYQAFFQHGPTHLYVGPDSKFREQIGELKELITAQAKREWGDDASAIFRDDGSVLIENKKKGMEKNFRIGSVYV